jgi:amino acid transporter
MPTQKSPKQKVLGAFALSMINIAAIASLRNLPVMAVHGFELIFYLVLASLFFFLPTALIAAELVAQHPEEGGIYVWVHKAFGGKIGALAVWLQWIGVVVWYPTSLVFVAATLGMLIHPGLGDNSFFIFPAVVTLFAICTQVNLRGMKISGLISSWGVMIGTLVPGVAIILLGISWWITGQPLQMQVGWTAWIPHQLQPSQIPLLCGIAVSFIGMEMSEVHASDVAKPQSTYPKAIFISAAAIFAIYALGSLAIASVVKRADLSLTYGLLEGFTAFLNAYHVGWLRIPFACAMIAGVIAGISTWIVGPSRGLLVAAEEGYFPAWLKKRNPAGMPVNVMALQFALVTALTSAFVLLPSVQTAFIVLTALGSQVVMIMYALMFAAAVRLRSGQKGPKKAGLFQIPGRYGLGIVALMGWVGTSVIFIVGLFPEENLSWITYDLILLAAIALTLGLPLMFKQTKS